MMGLITEQQVAGRTVAYVYITGYVESATIEYIANGSQHAPKAHKMADSVETPLVVEMATN